MNISKINHLLSEVHTRLDSLNPSNMEEGIPTINAHASHGKAVSKAKSRVNDLMSKLTKGRPGSTKVKSTGSNKR